MAGLRREGVSCIFARERDLDLRLALEILQRELGSNACCLRAAAVPTAPSFEHASSTRSVL